MPVKAFFSSKRTQVLLPILCLLIFIHCYVKSATADEPFATVLLYQRIGQAEYGAVNISKEDFSRHLQYIHENGYTVMPLGEIVKAMRDGAPLPEKSVAITLDDGFRTHYTQAWPLLQKYNFPFTVFLATDHQDKELKDYMSWDQVRDMAQDGRVTIGHQGAAHVHAMRITPRAFAKDVHRASESFFRELGFVPKLYSYPYGEVSKAHADVLREANFLAAFGEHSSPLTSVEDIYILPRYPMTGSYAKPERFGFILRLLPFQLKRRIPGDPAFTQDLRHLKVMVDWSGGKDHPPDLACYAAGKSLALRIGIEGFAIALAPQLLKLNKIRINCTYKDESGLWHWLGWQLFKTR